MPPRRPMAGTDYREAVYQHRRSSGRISRQQKTRRSDAAKPRGAKLMGLNERIEALLGQKASAPHTLNFDRVYHESFEASGVSKAQEILTDLVKRTCINLDRCGYFSIGGSTGSEIFHVMSNSTISHGLLLEYDPTATEIAASRRDELRAMGKNLVVVTGDATQRLQHCKTQFLAWRESQQIRGLIVSAQAILHELPSRSPGFDLDHFLGEIIWDWDPFLLYTREPSTATDWPDRVEIHVPALRSSILEALANDIKVSLKMNGVVRRSGPDYVALPADLAVETVTKIFYLEDYQHEIEEQVTLLRPAQLRVLIEKHLGNNSTTLTELSSQSFTDKYRQLGILARRSPAGERLSIPHTFARIIAERVSILPPPMPQVETPTRGGRTGPRKRGGPPREPRRPVQVMADEKTSAIALQQDLSQWVEEAMEDWRANDTENKLVVDPVQGIVQLEPLELALLNAPILQRLQRMSQTGLAFYVYPAATYSVLTHALGAVSTVEQILNSIGRHERIDPNLRRHVRLAALLQNVGVLPFSHLGATVVDRQFGGLTQRLRKGAVHGESRFFEDNSLPEILSYLIVTAPAFETTVQAAAESLGDRGTIVGDWRLDLELIGRIMLGKRSPTRESWLSDVVTGAFGASVLDHVQRDAVRAGIHPGADVIRIIDGMRVVKGGMWDGALSFSRTSVTDLQGLLLTKLRSYAALYHHHRIRAAECMFYGMIEELAGSNSVQLPRSVRGWLGTSEHDLLPDSSRLGRRDLIRRCLVLNRTTIGRDSWVRFVDLALQLQDPQRSCDLRQRVFSRLPQKMKTTVADLWVDSPRPSDTYRAEQRTLIRSAGDDVQPLSQILPIAEWLLSDVANEPRITVFYSEAPAARARVADIVVTMLGEEFDIGTKPLARSLARIPGF